MAKFITAFDVFERLHAAGIVQHEPTEVRRVVIDLEAGKIALVYVELFADSEKLLAGLMASVDVTGPRKGRLAMSTTDEPRPEDVPAPEEEDFPAESPPAEDDPAEPVTVPEPAPEEGEDGA